MKIFDLPRKIWRIKTQINFEIFAIKNIKITISFIQDTLINQQLFYLISSLHKLYK